MRNELSLNLKKISDEKPIAIDGIEFRNCGIIEYYFDNEKPIFAAESLIVFPELEKSAQKNGIYLIFTSASGITDELGWEGICVTHGQDIVMWDFEYDDADYQFVFSKNQYLNSISKIKKLISEYPKLDIEPVALFPPESSESSH